MITFIDLNENKQEKLVFNRPGEYVVFFHNLSGDFMFDIRSADVRLDIFGLYFGKKEDEYNIHTVQNHHSPSSISNLLIKGVFDGFSKFRYQGLVRIEKEAQKSHAFQKNQNLMISPNAFVDSKPYLEILANDVFCTHGSTTGKPNEESLFYIKTRGMDQETARKLLIVGFMNDIIDKIREKIPDFQFSLPE